MEGFEMDFAAEDATGFCGRCLDGFCYEVTWHHEWTRVTPRAAGTTGWATVLRSTNPKLSVGTVTRIHRCANNPCTAMWPVASRVSAPATQFAIIAIIRKTRVPAII